MIAGVSALIVGVFTLLPLPDQVTYQWAIKAVSLLITVALIYLTITGSSLLRLDISEDRARRELQTQAEARALA